MAVTRRAAISLSITLAIRCASVFGRSFVELEVHMLAVDPSFHMDVELLVLRLSVEASSGDTTFD